MSFRKFGVGACLLCLELAAPEHAFAQAAGSPPDPTSVEGKRAEGKARYERGVDAYSAGRYKDAIDLFLQADALAPSAALSFNIARAYEKIGDDGACLQWYRDFRRRAPDAKNAREVDERIHALELVLAKKGVQQFSVLSSPYGATVIVDDQPLGVTPFTGQLPPGKHKVVLSLRGYSDSEQRLELAPDRAQDLNVTLVPAREQVAAPVVTEQPAPEKPHESPPRQPEPAAGARFGVAPWIGIGAGVAALGGALGFELARRGAEDDAKSAKSQVDYKHGLDREQNRQLTARVLATVGGVLVVAGGTLLVIDLTSSRKERASDKAQARLGGACLPGACALNVQGQF
jgi:tetratricopeptide (TPR) repeat protein